MSECSCYEKSEVLIAIGITMVTSVLSNYLIYTVSPKKLRHCFTAYNFRNIEQIFTKFGLNQSLFILNVVPEFI